MQDTRPQYLAVVENAKRATAQEGGPPGQVGRARSQAATAKLQLYVVDGCTYCERAKELLVRYDVRFDEIFVEENKELQAWIVSHSGRKVLPQLFVRERHLGGFFELRRMSEQGSLEILLFR